MQLHQLKPKHKLKKRKRIGRGGKRGSYSGKGIKGQKSRSGARFQPIIHQIIKRYQKLRGYKFKGFKLNEVTLSIENLDRKFESGEKISPQILIEKKIIRKIKGRIPKIKILGRGEIKKALIIENCLISKQAREKIEKAGGQIK